MKKENKILALFILGIFAISIIAGVAAAQEDLATGLRASFESIFSKWQEGQVGANVAKIIFFIMITLLITLVLNGIFTGWNNTVVLIISGLVAFLATAYITPSDVYSLLNSYTALGLTLTTIIPFLILSGFTYQAAKKGNVSMIMMQYFAWVLFLVYSLYRFITDWAITSEGSGFTNGIILATTIAAVLVVFLNKKIRNWIARVHYEALKEAAGKGSEEAVAEIELLKGMFEKQSGEKSGPSVYGGAY